MKKLLSLFVIIFIFFFDFSQLHAQNIATSTATALQKSSQLQKCLSYKVLDTNKVQLIGNDFPTNETAYIVDCVPTDRDFICTTGNKIADEVLHITKSSPHSFSLIGSSNPMTIKGGILKVNANADMTGGKIHIFSAVILRNASSLSIKSKAINFDKLNFFDQDLTECQKNLNLSNPDQAIPNAFSANTSISTINYGIMANDSKMFIVGKVSHPSAQIDFLQNGKIIAETAANKYGDYSLLIDNKKIDQTAQIGVQYTKLGTGEKSTNTLIRSSLPNFFIANAQTALTSSFLIDPIFSYVEGFAYDAAGKTLSNAIINIKLKNSEDVYYSTNADERGFFTIAPEFLPIYAYEIEIKNPTNKAINKQQTTQFANKNKDYLVKNKINMVTATINNKPLVKAANTSISKNQLAKPSLVVKNNSNRMDDPNSIIFTLIVLIVIVTIIGITLYFLYKNNTYDKDDKHLF